MNPISEGNAMAPPVDDTGIYTHVVLDQAEGRWNGRNVEGRWEGQAWSGTDVNKLWLKSEGRLTNKGRLEDSQHSLLYDRPISTYFDLQAGVRTDLDSNTSRTWGAVGIQGLSLYFFDLEATAYASDRGHFAGRVSASYDMLITNRLILQPQVEVNFYSKDDPGRRIGSGLSTVEAGLRLRYEISRKFAPYVGMHYEGQMGRTASFIRSEGEASNTVGFVFGVRTWF
jgi:copper resistance protein B